MIYSSRFVKLFAIIALLALSCKEDEIEVAQSTNQKIYDFMQGHYLWTEEIPDLEPDAGQDPYQFFESLLFRPVDRWSFMMDSEDYEKSRQGISTSFGWSLILDQNKHLRIAFTYDDSPAGKAGLDRSDKVLKVNGETIETLLAEERINEAFGIGQADVKLELEVEKSSGNIEEITIEKGNVDSNTVLYHDIITVEDYTIGYVVFNRFIEKANDELDQVFQQFKAADVDDVILDLRYNGGGSIEVAVKLASLLNKPSSNDEVFIELTYNEILSDQNEKYFFKTETNVLNIDRLFVITTRNSASSSEAIINGLRPYLPVTTIGSATYGKPVGQVVNTDLDGYAVGPLAFYVNNSLGEADYFDGIPADYPQMDDLSAPFGDLEEDCLATAISAVKGEPARMATVEDKTQLVSPLSFGTWMEVVEKE